MFSFLKWIATAAFLLPGLGSSQDVTEPALKAAFIYNFAKFTEWPSAVLPPAAPIVICVAGDPAVRNALEQMSRNRLLQSHKITVLPMLFTGRAQDCHILYISGIPAKEVARLVTGLRDSPVLTISDSENFTDIGGITEFFFDRGKLCFYIRFESMKRAHLQISAQLLEMGQQR